MTGSTPEGPRSERRLIRMSPSSRVVDEEAVTARHYPVAWLPVPSDDRSGGNGRDGDGFPRRDGNGLHGNGLHGNGPEGNGPDGSEPGGHPGEADDRGSTAGPDEPDDGWLFGEDDRTPVPHPDAVTELLPHGRTAPGRAGRERRRRVVWPAIAAVLVLALAGGAFFARDLVGVFFPADYPGPGTGRVVVEVAEGDSTRAIGEELVGQDVVASSRAFGSAAEENPDGRGIQPGYYQLSRQMSAAGAVDTLLDPAARLGRLEVRSGTQLDDTAGPNGSTVPGVLSLVGTATCTPVEGGEPRCATADEVRSAMATTDPAELGVPGWALDGVTRADPARRLEGLLAPGTYDVRPGISPREALAQVVRESADRLERSGVVTASRARGVDPYEALTVASLAEKEGVARDFGKVSRVIYNRLAVPMRLQFDSTINYPLDRQELLTTPFDRARPGPYNSYLNLGLPPTPIGAVSPGALRAALAPDPGPWVYFVKCRTDGESCFAVTQPEHDANRRLAQERGVY